MCLCKERNLYSDGTPVGCGNLFTSLAAVATTTAAAIYLLYTLTGRTRVVNVLLQAGAKIDALDDERTGTALGHAAHTLHNDTVTALTQAGARLKNAGVDKSAIHVATLSQNLGIVEDLISAGANVNAGYPEDQNRTALHLAVAYGMTLLAQVLMRAGSNINQADETGCTPLYSAAYVGNLQCVIELLTFGADMLITNNDGHSPLEASSQEGHVAIVKALLDHGVLQPSPRSSSAWVAFTALCAAARSGQTNTADILLKAGVPPVQEGINRTGPLSSAAMAGHLGVRVLFCDVRVRTHFLVGRCTGMYCCSATRASCAC